MLFTTIAEIKAVLPVGAGNDYNRLKPHIANAENRYIKPLLGTNMYDELVEFFEADYPATPNNAQIAMKELLGKVQFSVIHLAYFIGFDFLNVSVSDAGFLRTESTEKKGLFRYQEDNLKDYFKNAGFDALDDVLVYMEENIANFSEFKSSASWTEFREMFIPTVKILEQIPFNINGSRLTFLALKPYFSYIEDTELSKLLGAITFAEIKDEMAKDQPAAKVTAILPYIRKPLIYLASAMLMEETGATLGDKGLYFEKAKPPPTTAARNNRRQPTRWRLWQRVTV